jgi:hypothetical protein
MAVLLMLCLLAVFGGVWLFFAALWLMFRLTFWFVGGLFGLLASGIALLVLGMASLVMLPLLGLMLLLPLAFPLLLVGGLVWMLTRNSYRPIPVTIRR